MTKPKRVAINQSLSPKHTTQKCRIFVEVLAASTTAATVGIIPCQMTKCLENAATTCVANVQSTNRSHLHRACLAAWPPCSQVTHPCSARDSKRGHLWMASPFHDHAVGITHPIHGITSLQPAGTAFYQREPILATSGFSTKTVTTDLKSKSNGYDLLAS